MNEIILAEHYQNLLNRVKTELSRRGYNKTGSLRLDAKFDVNHLNREVEAEDIWFLQQKLDDIKRFDSNSSYYYKYPDNFLNDRTGRLADIKYTWDNVKVGDLIVKKMIELAGSKLDNHVNVCVCNCNYRPPCSCNCNRCTCDSHRCPCDCNRCTCDSNRCPCNCNNYCACNCNFRPPCSCDSHRPCTCDNHVTPPPCSCDSHYTPPPCPCHCNNVPMCPCDCNYRPPCSCNVNTCVCNADTPPINCCDCGAA